MKKRIITLIVIVLAIIAIVYWSKRSSPTPQTTYVNNEYGYSLRYPSSLSVKEYTPENITIGSVADESVESVADVSIVSVPGSQGETYMDSVVQTLKNMCAADGPSTSFSCTDVEQLQPFTTASDETGQIVYLQGTLTHLDSGETELSGRGPFYVLLLKTGATGSSVLVIHPPMNVAPDQVDSATIRSIAESISLNK